MLSQIVCAQQEVACRDYIKWFRKLCICVGEIKQQYIQVCPHTVHMFAMCCMFVCICWSVNVLMNIVLQRLLCSQGLTYQMGRQSQISWHKHKLWNTDYGSNSHFYLCTQPTFSLLTVLIQIVLRGSGPENHTTASVHLCLSNILHHLFTEVHTWQEWTRHHTNLTAIAALSEMISIRHMDLALYFAHAAS